MIPLTQAQLQAIVAGIFSYLESKVSTRPALLLATEIVAAAVNGELPALYAWLKAQGIVS